MKPENMFMICFTLVVVAVVLAIAVNAYHLRSTDKGVDRCHDACPRGMLDYKAEPEVCTCK